MPTQALSSTYGFSRRFAAVAAAAGCAVSTSSALTFPPATNSGTASAWARGSATGPQVGSRTPMFEATAKEFGKTRNVQKARPTTDRERVIATLRSYLALKEDWDGEGASAPRPASVRAASEFARALSDSVMSPAAMLHASGNASLLWDEDDFYGEVEFLDAGRAAYYFETNSGKHKGVAQLPSIEVPEFLSSLLPAA